MAAPYSRSARVDACGCAIRLGVCTENSGVHHPSRPSQSLSLPWQLLLRQYRPKAAESDSWMWSCCVAAYGRYRVSKRVTFPFFPDSFCGAVISLEMRCSRLRSEGPTVTWCSGDFVTTTWPRVAMQRNPILRIVSRPAEPDVLLYVGL